MQKEPPPFVWAAPDEKNILIWNYLIRGPSDSPYAGGEYHGVLLFPADYPFKPPGIKMYTPSGRFQPDKKICFSMSDFHPGSWNPAWSVATILTGLLSFMLSDEMTTGSVTSSDAHKKVFAARSHSWNLTQSRFREAFPEYCTPELKDPPNMGQRERGKSDPAPSPRPPPSPSPSSTSASQTSDLIPPAPSQSSTPAGATLKATAAPLPVVPRGHTNNVRGKPDEVGANRGNAATGWAAAWRQVIWEKWRWCALIALAVMVSRFSTST